MATTRISDNQIDEATAATITTLNFLNTNSEFKIPVGDTATRPGTPAIGMMRFNSENDKAEIYVADFDGDGKNELLLSMQNVKDSLTNTVYNWNGSGMDTSTYTYANPKAWTVILLENSENTLSNEEEPITFIAPEQYKLSQNYPNPFNPNTTIEYTIPINRKVSVKIYNVSGQLVNTLVDN